MTRTPLSTSVEAWVTTRDGRAVRRWVFGDDVLRVSMITCGATVTRIDTVDAHGDVADVAPGVAFTLPNPDGDQGFPGALVVRVGHTVSDAADRTVRYAATTDAPTVVNLTDHVYPNLAGEDAGDVDDHELLVRADRFTPVVEVFEPTTGRLLLACTDQPGVRVCTGNLPDGSPVGPGGRTYRQGSALTPGNQRSPAAPDAPDHGAAPRGGAHHLDAVLLPHPPSARGRHGRPACPTFRGTRPAPKHQR